MTGQVLGGYVLHGDRGTVRASAAGCEVFPSEGEPFTLPYPEDPLSEYAREMEAFDRAIDLRITRLRRKIERDPAHPEAIRTVRGVGYMFVPPKD